MQKQKRTETEEEIMHRGRFDKRRPAELKRMFAEQKGTLFLCGVAFIAGLVIGVLLARKEPHKE